MFHLVPTLPRGKYAMDGLHLDERRYLTIPGTPPIGRPRTAILLDSQNRQGVKVG